MDLAHVNTYFINEVVIIGRMLRVYDQPFTSEAPERSDLCNSSIEMNLRPSSNLQTLAREQNMMEMLSK